MQRFPGQPIAGVPRTAPLDGLLVVAQVSGHLRLRRRLKGLQSCPAANPGPSQLQDLSLRLLEALGERRLH